jgi:hypothetical protein
MEDTTNAQHIVRVNIALPTITNTPYGYAVYAKAAGRTQIRLTDNNVSGATFTLTGAGATSNLSSGVTAAINQLADGWYRCFITVAAASVNGRLALNLVSSDNITYTGDGNSGVYIYGAQLSDSASLDPYVPTPGAAPSSTAYYGPRFDYDPVTLLPRGLLVEEARTNLLLRSQEFDNAAWIPSNLAVTANAATAPDGTTTADLLSPLSTSAFIYQTVTLTATSYTYSVWLRSGTGANVALKLTANGTGVSPNPTSTDITVTPQWQRFTLTLTGLASGANMIVGGLNPGTWPSGATVYAWGAQLEAGAFATSYIPTIASTVTRSADVATITGSLFSQWYNQPAGGFVVEASTLKAPSIVQSVVAAEISDGGINNRHQISFVTSAARGQTTVGGVNQATIEQTYSSANATEKLGYAFAANDFAFARNGGLVGTDTSGTIPTVDRMFVGNAAGSAAFLSGHIRSIRYVPVRAADFQLQQVTT